MKLVKIMFKRILKWLEFRFYCQICLERSIFNHHKRCSSCGRSTCHTCFDEVHEKGMECCLYCGESWVKEVVFEPEISVDLLHDFNYPPILGYAVEDVNNAFDHVNQVLTPNEVREWINPVRQETTIRMGDQIIQPIDFQVQTDYQHTPIYGGLGRDPIRHISQGFEISGTMTLINMDMGMNPSYSNFSVYHGDQLIARDCHTQNMRQELMNNSGHRIIEIDWIGLPP